MLPALERWEDEIRKHYEITGAGTLNESTKKAIVTEMAPPEQATHLTLNADRYNTYAQMKRQVLSYVNLKLPSQPTTTWIDNAEQGEEDDQENANIDDVGKTAKGKGKDNGKGKGKKGKGDGDASNGGFIGRCCR